MWKLNLLSQIKCQDYAELYFGMKHIWFPDHEGKFERNKAFLEETKDWTQVIVLDPKRAMAILDINAFGYNKIQQGVLQQRLSKYCSFESLNHCKTYLKDTLISELSYKKKQQSQVIQS